MAVLKAGVYRLSTMWLNSFFYPSAHLKGIAPSFKFRSNRTIREIKFDVTWSNVKRQTGKMKLLSSVFSSLNSRVKIFVFVAISRRHFSIFM